MQSTALAMTPDVGAEKLTIEKFADGGIACLRFAGTIDESFEGKQLAATTKCETLLLDLGGVKKISSFGIREWVDFITTASKQADTVLLVECGPKIVDQLNMVANFAGSGRVYSFYAPYRCDYCDAEHRVLLTADRDHEAIKSQKLGNRPCPTCKDAMYFDEDPTSFFSYLLSQDKVELPAEVETFLAARLNYAVSDVARKLRVDKLIEGRLTYVRLAGDLDASFPRDKLADGLEGPVVLDVTGIGRIEPAGAAEWRGLVQLVTPLVEQLVIVGAGPSFLEKLTHRDDLGAKAVVATLALPYRCGACGTNRSQTFDVAQSYEVLKLGQAPEQRCAHCKAPMQVAASEAVLGALASLPRPTLGAEQLRVIADLVSRKLEKKKALPAAPSMSMAAAVPPVVVRGGGIATGVVSALVVVLLLGGAAVAYRLFTREQAVDLGKVTAASEPVKPQWVPTGGPLALASCAEASGGLSCTASSSLTPVQDDAIDEAREAALEAVAEALAQRIEAAPWRSAAAVWQGARAAKLAALEANPHSSQARRDVRQARRAVAALLVAQGGPPAPQSRYWEERTNKDGKQFQAFAQVQVPAAAVSRLVKGYARTTEVMGATVTELFPLVGWRYPEVSHGAILVGLGAGRLKQLGLAEQFLILEVGGRKVTGGEALAKLLPEEVERLQAAGGTLELSVQSGDGAPRSFTEQIARKAAPSSRPSGSSGSSGSSGGKSGNLNVNIWDRAGGDRDDPTQ